MSTETLIVVWSSDHSPRATSVGKALGAKVSFQYERGIKKRWALPWRYLVQGWKTWQMLEQERPATVIVRTPPIFAPILTVIWCKVRGKNTPFILDCDTGTYHSPKWRYALPLQRLLARQALVSLVIDEAAKAKVESWNAPVMLFEDNIPALVPPTSTIGSEGKKRIAVISSFDVDEPIAEIFAAARLLPEFTFYCTGDPNRASAKLIADKPANVVLTGYLRGGDYTGLLHNVQGLLVLTNEVHALNCGAYEALSLGKPAVVSDWPEMRRYFSRGFIHVQNTPTAIAEGLNQMLATLPGLSAEVSELRIVRATEWQRKFETLRGIRDRGQELGVRGWGKATS